MNKTSFLIDLRSLLLVFKIR